MKIHGGFVIFAVLTFSSCSLIADFGRNKPGDDAEPELDGEGDGDTDWNTDGDGDVDGDADGDADADGDGDTDGDIDGDGDGDADGDGDGDIDGDVDGDGDGDIPIEVEWAMIPPAHLGPEPFVMGSPWEEEGRDPDEAEHNVTVSGRFYMLNVEVTESMFAELMGYNPTGEGGCQNCPVGNVSWHEALAYCNALSEDEGIPEEDRCFECEGEGPDVTCDLKRIRFSRADSCPGYRLPTEAEWELAARAGSTGPQYGELDSVAWYADNAGEPQIVGQLQPNPWGLYDVLGNAWEWVFDWYGEYPTFDLVDPPGPAMGTERVGRGGAWNSRVALVRAANRSPWEPDHRGRSIGFRPVINF